MLTKVLAVLVAAAAVGTTGLYFAGYRTCGHDCPLSGSDSGSSECSSCKSCCPAPCCESDGCVPELSDDRTCPADTFAVTTTAAPTSKVKPTCCEKE